MLPCHDGVTKWKHFPRYWPFVRGIHRSPVNSPHKGQWREALMFSFIWIHGWVNNRKAGDLRRYRAHYDVTVMSRRVLGMQRCVLAMWFSSTLEKPNEVNTFLFRHFWWVSCGTLCVLVMILGLILTTKIVKVIDDFFWVVYPSTVDYYLFHILPAVFFIQNIIDGAPCLFYIWHVIFKFPPVISKFGFLYSFIQSFVESTEIVFRKWYLACERWVQISSLYSVSLCLIGFIIPCGIHLFLFLCLYSPNFTFLYGKYFFFICVKWSCRIS